MTDLTREIRESYEELPYRSGPHYASHPDCLATVARLRGLEAPDIARCRVLELGCATGGHLLPMALVLPGSEFVGVDLAPGHIATARESAEAVGLDNVRFLAADVRELPDDLGTFDYILCHGVYSWVPRDVREAVLSLMGEHLSEDGLATLSFNALPGSQPRNSVRGLFRFALERVLSPDTPVENARALLQTLPPALDGLEGAFVDQLRGIASECADVEGYYLAHEYLAPVNRPFHLWEVVRDAEAHGLHWVGDAWDHDDGEGLPGPVQQLLDRLSPTRADRRQWLDLLQDRAFHRAVFCRNERIPTQDAMDASVVPELHAGAGAWPVSDDRQDPVGSAGAASAFASRTHRVSTNIPMVEVALRHLHDAWPASLPVRDLWEASRTEVRNSGADARAPAGLDDLSDALLRCYRHHLVSLHVRPFPVQPTPTVRPLGSPLARHQAGRGPEVTNLVHQRVRLGEAERRVLRVLDGERDRVAVLAAVAMEEPGEEMSEEQLEGSLEVLGRAGLLHVDSR